VEVRESKGEVWQEARGVNLDPRGGVSATVAHVPPQRTISDHAVVNEVKGESSISSLVPDRRSQPLDYVFNSGVETIPREQQSPVCPVLEEVPVETGQQQVPMMDLVDTADSSSGETLQPQAQRDRHGYLVRAQQTGTEGSARGRSWLRWRCIELQALRSNAEQECEVLRSYLTVQEKDNYEKIRSVQEQLRSTIETCMRSDMERFETELCLRREMEGICRGKDELIQALQVSLQAAGEDTASLQTQVATLQGQLLEAEARWSGERPSIQQDQLSDGRRVTENTCHGTTTASTGGGPLSPSSSSLDGDPGLTMNQTPGEDRGTGASDQQSTRSQGSLDSSRDSHVTSISELREEFTARFDRLEGKIGRIEEQDRRGAEGNDPGIKQQQTSIDEITEVKMIFVAGPEAELYSAEPREEENMGSPTPSQDREHAVEETNSATTCLIPRERRGHKRRREARRYNVGPRFSDSDEADDLAAHVYQHRARGRRTQRRNAELHKLAREARLHEEAQQQRVDHLKSRKAQLRADLTVAERDFDRAVPHSQQHVQLRGEVEALGEQFAGADAMLTALIAKVKEERDGRAAAMQLRRKVLGCSSLDSSNGYGHPGTMAPFDIECIPFFEGTLEDDPEEWEKQVRDLCAEYNLYGRKLIDYLNQRIGPNVIESMRGFNLKSEDERGDPSQWFAYFRQIHPMDIRRAYHRQRFQTLTQEDAANYQDYLNKLRHAYAKGWPDAVPLENDKEKVKDILCRFYNGMAPGPGEQIKESVRMCFFMKLDKYVQYPVEDVFAKLLETTQAAYRNMHILGIGGEGMVMWAEAASGFHETALIAPARCLHCKKGHVAKRCHQAAESRRETLRMLYDANSMRELSDSDQEDIQEDVVRALVDEVDGQPELCFECHDEGHLKRDCPKFFRRMRAHADRFQIKRNREQQIPGVQLSPGSVSMAGQQMMLSSQFHQGDLEDAWIYERVKRALNEMDYGTAAAPPHQVQVDKAQSHLAGGRGSGVLAAGSQQVAAAATVALSKND
jgi:hypothetical protein